ncbi:hypothetical protein NCS56_00434400 [Fusarium sp. Ph1]|nr:hypothetical protein NCS56_00434400 [Fusarium sp. Ph1]
MSSVQSLIFQYPTNSIDNLDITSYTSKTWAKSYAPLRRYRLHMTMDMGSGEVTGVDFDTAFLPLMDDEEKRTSEVGQLPNARHCSTEARAGAPWLRRQISMPSLLILQFRAQTANEIRDENCEVGCWILPLNTSICTFRYALYRLMVQGLRRCQVGTPGPLTVGGLTETHRKFFSVQPIWSLNGNPSYTHPGGYSRVVDKETGALGWVHPEQDPQGAWETGAIW